MTNVFVVVADPVFDCFGDLVEDGDVIGVYASEVEAAACVEYACGKTSFRKKHEYTIKEMKIGEMDYF